MKVAVIIVAAGESRRLPAKERKPYLRLGKKPILLHVLAKFISFSFVSQIIVVVNKKDLELARKLIRNQNFNKDIKIIEGRKRRTGSVYQGLKHVTGDCEYIIVHDAVRPFFKRELFRKLMKEVEKYKAVILATPVKPTIKQLNGNYFIKKTLSRSTLWQAQTPQVFRKDILLKAYKKINYRSKRLSDDSSLVERLGIKVKVIPGNGENIKITTPVDFALAKLLFKKGIK